MASAVAIAEAVLDNLFRAPLRTLALLRKHHSHPWPCRQFGLRTVLLLSATAKCSFMAFTSDSKS